MLVLCIFLTITFYKNLQQCPCKFSLVFIVLLFCSVLFEVEVYTCVSNFWDIVIRIKSTLRLRTAQIELDKVTAQLKEKQEKLATIEAKVCLKVSHLNSS